MPNRVVRAPGRTLHAASLAGLAACALWACAAEGPEARAEARAHETGYRGFLLPEPLQKPDFTLPDTEGEPFDFRAETAGRLTLLFFGYTHCPDVCPVHMANLAAVLADLPYAVRQRVQVVFVTTDPERDTAERLRSWLDRFDPSFIGLRGELSEVNRIQASLHLPPAVREPGEGEEYVVGHATQVIAFGPASNRTVLYPFGTRQSDWAHDLPRLAAPAPATEALAPGRTAPAPPGPAPASGRAMSGDA